MMEVELIIKSTWIVPVVPRATILKDYAIIIHEKKILGILPQQEALDQYSAKHIVQLDDHVLIPGLINSHCHASMTLLRGTADDLPLDEWLQNRIWPLEKEFMSREFVVDGAELAIAEMITSGTTCFADMYFFPDEVAKTAISANMRVQLASPILDFPSIWAANADEYILKATQTHDQYRNSDLVSTAFGPHSLYTVSDEPLSKIGMLADELDIPIHVHMHETKNEIQDSMQSFGVSPLTRLKNLGLITPRLVSVHCTHLMDHEIELLSEQGANVVHCPNSNMKLASGICNVSKLIHHGINVALGTDGAASNNRLDMFGEMRAAALLAKVSTEDATSLPAHMALEMATIHGAMALGLEEKIGSLEPGKFADVVAVSLNEFNTLPINDPISHLIYGVNSSQVSHAWIGGKNVMCDGSLLTLEKTKIIESALSWQTKMEQN
jgi:5-methylthioadenosine/S-adenosylhomocysteine deaminase